MTFLDVFLPWLMMFGGIVVVAMVIVRRGR